MKILEKHLICRGFIILAFFFLFLALNFFTSKQAFAGCFSSNDSYCSALDSYSLCNAAGSACTWSESDGCIGRYHEECKQLQTYFLCIEKATDANCGWIGPTSSPEAGVARPTDTGPSGGKSLDDLKGEAATLNKLGISNPAQLIGRFINMLLAFIGSISLVLYIVAGFLWMTASGNTEKVTKAKSIMVWTTLGIVVMLASYMLASFLFKSLGV